VAGEGIAGMLWPGSSYPIAPHQGPQRRPRRDHPQSRYDRNKHWFRH
jgi:hypothetical protein